MEPVVVEGAQNGSRETDHWHCVSVRGHKWQVPEWLSDDGHGDVERPMRRPISWITNGTIIRYDPLGKYLQCAE